MNDECVEENVLEELLKLLKLEKIEENIFRGQSQDLGFGAVFGGVGGVVPLVAALFAGMMTKLGVFALLRTAPLLLTGTILPEVLIVAGSASASMCRSQEWSPIWCTKTSFRSTTSVARSSGART